MQLLARCKYRFNNMSQKEHIETFIAGNYTDPILVFFGTKIAELRKHPFPNLFPQIFRIRTVIFPQSGLNAKSMPEKTKIGSVYKLTLKEIEENIRQDLNITKRAVK